VACALVSQFTGNVAETPIGSSQPGVILFEDDFSSPSSGWDQYSDDGGLTNYDNGVYRIRVDSSYYEYWENQGVDFRPSDVYVRVDATKSAGPYANDFGLICRYSEGESTACYYQFAVTSDGYAGIILVRDNNQLVLSQDNVLQPYGAINQSSATNRIVAECVGSTLALYVNDMLVESLVDHTLTDGNVGLMAESYEKASVDILFDDFMDTKP
jgi:hypothetical protein